MSYSYSSHDTIAVHYSGSVRYPASENGGTVSYSGTEYEDITINIDVDTLPFDTSVAGCNSSVNILTGAVVATETAQIASINRNAEKVGNTIVEGFFKTIRSEISQQIMELSKKIESHLLHLNELKKSCVSKQRQMETDYNRISGRYLKIFDDLNNELSNRIYELNRPAFVFKSDSDKHATRSSGNDLVSTVAVLGRESSGLQAKISASIVKKRALDSITQANVFLWKQKKTENTINQSMLNESIAASLYSPICLVETQNEKSQIDRNIYQSGLIPQMTGDKLTDDFQSKKWSSISKENIDKIQRYFNAELNNAYITNNQHENRVKEMIARIFDVNSIKEV